ncbi:unnamed protein product [Allacma fusca]|uniref:Uncharacterized protein n=1 Tax=Allacma fusca TaxID=39272 RepID=A0A8J2JU70_9HEXA|nr:unnamed protein product [Allacma fusca]
MGLSPSISERSSLHALTPTSHQRYQNWRQQSPSCLQTIHDSGLHQMCLFLMMNNNTLPRSCEGDQELNELFKEYFSTKTFVVNLSAKSLRPNDDKAALQIMEVTTKRVGDRFQKGHLWRQVKMALPGSKSTLQRLECVER